MSLQYQTTNANTPSIQTVATALATNPARIFWSIQNCGTNPVYVLMGTGASTTVFHLALQACTAVNDGKGGLFSQSGGVVFTGPVTIAGTLPNYVVSELAP